MSLKWANAISTGSTGCGEWNRIEQRKKKKLYYIYFSQSFVLFFLSAIHVIFDLTIAAKRNELQ
jgi:hypothetical protein